MTLYELRYRCAPWAVGTVEELDTDVRWYRKRQASAYAEGLYDAGKHPFLCWRWHPSVLRGAVFMGRNS